MRVTLSVLLTVASTTCYAQTTPIDGWGVLKFGQTHQQASSALDGRGDLQSDGKILTTTMIAGEDYQVTVDFDGDRLKAVQLKANTSLMKEGQCHQRRLDIAKSLDASYGKTEVSTFDNHSVVLGSGFQNFIESSTGKIVLTEFNYGSGLTFRCEILLRYMENRSKPEGKF